MTLGFAVIVRENGAHSTGVATMQRWRGRLTYNGTMDYFRFSEEHGKEWAFTAHEFWRRLYRDTSYSRVLTRAQEQAVTDYLEDVPRYARWRKEHDPEAKTNLLSESFVADFMDIKASHRLPEAWAMITTMMKDGVLATNVAQLSNWVNMLAHVYKPAEWDTMRAAFEDGLQWLTTQPGEPRHPFDNLYVFLVARTLGQQDPLASMKVAQSVASDPVPERVASRWMTVMQHTDQGDAWWKALMQAHGAADMQRPPLLELPDPNKWLQRRERNYQAWWRYAPEMEASPEFGAMVDWVRGLRATPEIEMTLPSLS